MKTRIINIWGAVHTSFWFVPTLMTAGSIALAFAMLAVDTRAESQSIKLPGWIYQGGAEGARTLLSTIAGSVMTVAGVAFSITIVALTLASSQFGPRLLRNFIANTGNQVVLGTFIGSFIYCLLVLRAIRNTGQETFVPFLSITVAVFLALAAVGVLIYFIHHIAASIQADNVIASVSAELKQAIIRFIPPESESNAAIEKHPQISRLDSESGYRISALREGYLQAIDYEGLVKLAHSSDLVLRLNYRPGKFIVLNSTLALAWPRTKIEKDLEQQVNAAFLVGEQRSPEQDVEFAIHQLVEIADRALSPGINDPFTAISCIDRLTAALCELAESRFPPTYRLDDENNLRLIIEVTTFAGAVEAAFAQIRQYGKSSVPVAIRLLESLEIIAGRVKTEDRRRVLRKQAEMIESASQKQGLEKYDRKDVNERYQAVTRKLEGKE